MAMRWIMSNDPDDDSGIGGVFTYEVAETKVSQVIDFARENQHPLQCTLEKA